MAQASFQVGQLVSFAYRDGHYSGKVDGFHKANDGEYLVRLSKVTKVKSDGSMEHRPFSSFRLSVIK